MSFTTTQMKLKTESGDYQNIYPACAKQGKVTLSKLGWSDEKTQTVPVSSVLIENFSGWAPTFDSLIDYKNAGILLTAIDEASLTFSAEAVPTVDVEISVISL